MDILFSKEKHVLEIFYNQIVYTKNERGFQNHNSSKFHWPQSIKSNAGFVNQQTLFLPKNSDTVDSIEKCDLLIITDYHPEFSRSRIGLLKEQGFIDRRGAFVHNHYLVAKHQQAYYGILKFIVQNPLRIHLEYDLWGVGIPKRDNFLIANVLQDKKVRILINGKNDFSMSSRRERTYKEQDFLLHYHGAVNGCKLMDDKEITKDKPVVLENYRNIDLRKTLF